MTERSPASAETELRPAATTILVRPGTRGPELLFVKRPDSMRFLGGFHAFPGGALDRDDFSEDAVAISTLSSNEAEGRLKGDSGDKPAIGFFVCALREIFEEIGILYTDDSDALMRIGDDEIEKARGRLLKGEATFPEIVSGFGVKLSTHKLRYHSRRTAPPFVPVRFDARVFVGPAEGDPRPDPNEVAAVDWFSTAQALAMAEMATIRIAPPTLGILSMLGHFDSVESLLEGKAVEKAPPEIERHSDLVRRLVAPNASVMTGPGTNTYLVGREQLVAIDPGTLDPGHLKALASAGPLKMIVITHRHPDHFTGAVELAGVTGARIAVSSTFPPYDLPEDSRRLSDGDLVEVPGVTLEVIETPGHASDHISLWFREEKALFSGDLILGEGTSVISPPDGKLSSYLGSLERVLVLAAERLYPGHYPPRDDVKEWIEYYVSHRKERDEQILTALASGPRSIPEIVAEVYATYPKALHPVAERSVLAHLERLEDRKEVSEKNGTWSRI